MHWRIPLFAVLALFVAVSCDQQPVEPTGDQVASAPAFDFMNNADIQNPKVIRTEEHFAWLPWDVEDQLIGILATGPFVCGLAEDMDPLSTQYITDNPPDQWPEALVRVLQKGDVWVAVWDGSGLTWDEFGPTDWSCDYFTENDPLAVGYAKMIWHDNDAFAWTCERNRQNVFGFKARGRLDLHDGSGGATFNYEWWNSWNCEKENGFVRETLKLN
jgi:hypothetical protein